MAPIYLGSVLISGSGSVSLPTVSITRTPASVLEDGATNLVFTVSRTGSTSAGLTVNYNIGGTAINGTDYASIGASVTMSSGESSGIITINPSTDATLEGNETVILTLAADASYIIGTPNSATGRIMNDEAGSNVFAFASSATTIVSESAGVAEIAVTRSGSTTAAATIEYTLTAVPGGATPGADYSIPSELGTNLGQIVFGTGQSSQNVSVPIVNDGTTEGSETFAVAIQNPSSGSLGAPRTARVLVVDNDGASRVSYLSADLEVAHDAGNLVVTLIRAGSSAASASVLLTANAGTAIAGTHFTATSTTATFPIGNIVQTVNVPILATAPAFNFADFSLTLSIPSGASIEGSTSAEVRILGPGVDLGSLILEEFAGDLDQPVTFDWIPGDPETMLVAEKTGVVTVVESGVARLAPLVDLSAVVNTANDRGMLGLAVHPNFSTGSPYVYVSYNYDPPETIGASGNSAPDGNGNRPARVERLTVNPATLLVTSSSVLIGTNSTWAFTSRPDLNSNDDLAILPSGIVNGTTITASAGDISTGYQDNAPTQLAGTQNQNIRDYITTDSLSHGVGNLEFGPDGFLYFAVGDGSSYNFVDSRAIRTQDIGNLSGKILRIDPITGNGIPSNPYYSEASGTAPGTSNQSKVFYYGLRNPYRFTFDPVTELPIIGDVGYTQRESIHTGPAGSNFGWPYIEGDITTPGYGSLSQAVAFFGNGNINAGSPNSLPSVAPLRALTHGSPDNFTSLTMGQFYTNDSFAYADLIDGRVFSATLDPTTRAIASTSVFDTGIQYLTDIRTGPDGNIYGCQIYGAGFGHGRIVRWIPDVTPPPSVAATFYFPFDEDLLDASGNNFVNLNLANGPTFDPDLGTPLGNGAAYFNGNSNDCMDLGEYPEFFNPGTGDFCIAFWSRVDTAGFSGEYPPVISKGSYQSSAGAWSVFYHKPNDTAMNFSYGNPWVEDLKSTVADFPGNTFRHTYIQRSGNTMTMRINDVLTDTADVTGVDFTSSHNLFIGKDLTGNYWNGPVRDLVYIVGDILTPEQVTALQTAPFSSLSTPPAPTLLNSSTDTLPSGTVSKTATIGFTPTAGNKLVAICAAAATFTIPSGWTRLSQRIDLWESVVFTKNSDGTETSMSWTQNGARQATVTFLEFPSFATVELSAAWASIPNIQLATSLDTDTISHANAVYVYARTRVAVDDDLGSVSHTYSTTGDVTEIYDGTSGLPGAGNEAVKSYVAYAAFTNGPRIVSWTMTPSAGVAVPADAVQLLIR